MLSQKSIVHPVIELACSGIINAILAVFFGIYTSEELPTCINLYYWSKIFLYVLIVSSVISFVLIPFAKLEPPITLNNQYAQYALMNPNMRIQTSPCVTIIKFIKYIFGFISLVCYAYLCEKYLDGEECGDLRTLVFVYLLLMGIAICVCFALVCCACLVAICCVGLIMNSRLGEIQGYEIPNRV